MNAYGVWLSGSDGGKARGTRANIKTAWAEITELCTVHDHQITKFMLTYCMKHHQQARKKHRENRKNCRDRYEVICELVRVQNGRLTYFPKELEFALAEWVPALRRGKFKVARGMIMNKMQSMCESPDVPELACLTGGINNAWYYRWMERSDFGTIVQREMDTIRAMWCTSAYMKVYSK